MYSLKELAKRVKESPANLYRYIRLGKIPGVIQSKQGYSDSDVEKCKQYLQQKHAAAIAKRPANLIHTIENITVTSDF